MVYTNIEYVYTFGSEVKFIIEILSHGNLHASFNLARQSDTHRLHIIKHLKIK